ncbi:hypothetical protein X798_06426, partial [Onchocerca flexuosa]
RLKKERETHPNFNILTDRAPTPDFSVTYIETSNNADDESVCKNEEENVIIAIDGMEKNVDAVNDQNIDSDFGEPMEVDDVSYFHQNIYCQNQDVHEIVDSTLPKNSMNRTFTIEKNEDGNDLLSRTDEDCLNKSDEHEPMLELRLDGTFIIEKLQKAEDNVMIPMQEREKEQRNISVHGSEYIDETTKNTPVWREMLNETVTVVAHQSLQAGDLVNNHCGDKISPQRSNQQVFGCPASLQATFDLSCIDKVDLSTGEKSEIPPVNPPPRISRFNLLEQMAGDMEHSSTLHPNDRTAVSFKTPRQHMKTVVEHTIVGKQSTIKKQPTVATPLFKKRSVASTTQRGTSTPIEGSACYVCPRYDAHHAALASRATQTGSGTPVSLHNRNMLQNTLTPIRRPLSCSLRIPYEPTTGKASTPSRIPVPTSALVAISQYGTPSPLKYGTPSPLKRSALVDYELTPQSHIHDKKHTPQQECSRVKSEHRNTNLMNSVTQIPLSRFAFEHLKSGGTPRPTSSTEKKWKKIAGDNSILSIPATPIAKIDISQMVVDNVMRSGPAYRRRPHPPKLLSPIGKLRFDNSSENSNLSSKNTSQTTKVPQNSPLTAQEEMNDTKLVVIDSFNSDTVERLAENTANLSIAEQQQSILSEEPKAIFDTTTSEYRKQQKIPIFDTGNYFGRRRILSIISSTESDSYSYKKMLNESNVSVNTPGKEEDLTVVEMNPSFSGDSRNPSDTSASPVHIIAAKDENKHAAVLCARKIVHCEEAGQGLRRSTRNRVAPIRRWLGEKPIYRRDQQGTYELVRVEEAIIKDPLFIKYNTIDMSEVLERQKREQKQHARARKLRDLDRARRGYTKKDRNQ